MEKDPTRPPFNAVRSYFQTVIKKINGLGPSIIPHEGDCICLRSATGIITLTIPGDAVSLTLAPGRVFRFAGDFGNKQIALSSTVANDVVTYDEGFGFVIPIDQIVTAVNGGVKPQLVPLTTVTTGFAAGFVPLNDYEWLVLTFDTAVGGTNVFIQHNDQAGDTMSATAPLLEIYASDGSIFGNDGNFIPITGGQTIFIPVCGAGTIQLLAQNHNFQVAGQFTNSGPGGL